MGAVGYRRNMKCFDNNGPPTTMIFKPLLRQIRLHILEAGIPHGLENL